MLSQIETAIAAVAPFSRSIVVFSGDYIDRGRDSRRVIDLLLNWRPPHVERHFLMGNHEQLLLQFLEDPCSGDAWLSLGGAATLASYGVQPPSVRSGSDALHAVCEALHARMPQTHLDFLRSLERYLAIGDFAFVHAGIDPRKTLDRQSDADLFWIRDRFLNHKRPMSHYVVHGHTPVTTPKADGMRISIDSGAYATGLLSAARIEGVEVSFLST